MLLMAIFFSSWDLWEKAKSKAKEVTREVLAYPDEDKLKIIQAKIDTLEATVNIGLGLNNQKHAQIKYIHLRLVKELYYYQEEFPPHEIQMYINLTDGRKGGSPLNRNWISGKFPYIESFDYEYVEERYPFDESIQLPSVSTNADKIIEGFLK